MSNDMENLRTFADQLWKYMVPKINAKLSSNVSYFRAEVVSNPGNNKLEVQRPVENGTLTLPCVRAMSGAQAGQQVVALVMGSMSNAIIVGDGKLNVPGGGGDAGVANFQAQPDGSLVITLTNGTTFTATPHDPTKQDVLTFDDAPTQGSSNPVKSGGIYTALNGKADNAFANVKVGSTTISADNNADTLTLIAGGLVTLTGNATNDSVTIYVDPNHTHITVQVLDLVNADSYGPSDLVTFDADVAEVPLKNCIVDIEPAQAGSGEPSPTNVRPISGWTGANVTRAGKNILSIVGYNIFKREFGITFDVVTNDDGELVKIVANGTDTSPSGNFSQVYFTVPQKVAGNFAGKTLTGGNTDFFIRVEKQISPYTLYAQDTGTGATIDIGVASAGNVYVICRVRKRATVSNLEIFPMIRDAGTSATFEPYDGEVVNVSFPDEAGTVYGGTLDVLSGELIVTMEQIASYAGESLPGAWISDRDAYSAGSTPTTGAQVVYDLATPITYQLSPQIISTLLGNNNIWADCGTISVDYGAFLSALDKAIEEHSDDDIRHITEAERETWDGMLNHTHDASDITSGILPAARGGTQNGNGYIQIGQKSGTTLAANATAEGDETTASGVASHAEGWGTTAEEFYAHAEGQLSTASGMASHAEGYKTTASGSYSHAEGNGTTASGSRSHAEGDGTAASGSGSHAEGCETVASGNYSHAEGYGTIAAGYVQHVFGKFNISDTQNLEIVGFGNSDTSRSNVRTLSKFGDEWIAGTLTQASDARLKDVQGEIPDLSSIRAVKFRWKNGDDKEHLGYLAQDVEGIAPYLVGVDSNGYKSLDYIALLTAKVEMLEREIEKLKGDT